jgi:type I restriction enzyme S subunit
MAIYKLNDIVNINRGSSPRPINNWLCNGDNLNELPWAKISDIDNHCIETTKQFVKKEWLSKGMIGQYNDLFLTNSATPGIPFFQKYNGSVGYHDGFLKITPDENIVYKKYLFYKLIIDQPKLLKMGNGSIFINLSVDILKNWKMSIPNLDEQQDIIDIIEQNKELFLKFHEIIRIDSKSNCMSDFKNLIDIIEPIELMINNIKSQIQKLRKLLLLNYEFNSSKDVISLKEITSLKANNYVGQKEYVATNAIGELSMDINKITNISKERPSRANLSVMRNSLIFSKMVGENKVWYIDEYSEKYIFSTGFFNIETKCVDFVAGFLLSNSFIQQKYNLSNGTTMVALNTRGYNDIKIRKPIDMILVNEHANNILRLVTKLQNLKNNLTNISDKMLKLLIV